MRNLIPGMAALLLMLGCNDHDAPPVRDSRDFCQNDGNCATEIHTDSRIDMVDHSGEKFVALVTGDSLVFEYRFEYRDNPQYIDDERVEFLYFQIDADAATFDYNTLPAGIVYYRKSCECIALDQEVTQGNIKGTKLSDTQWRIEADLIIDQGTLAPDREVIVNAVFTKQ